MAAPSGPATLLLLTAVVFAFALFALAVPRGPEPAALTRASTPLRQASMSDGSFTYLLVASPEQAARASSVAASIRGEVEVRIVASALDEERLFSDQVELNGFRAQTGLPEARVIDLR
jgi:hypothetical protein